MALKSEPGPASDAAAQLVEAMAAAWRRGERPGAEEFLARLGAVHDHPEPAIRLVYEEICLRQELGQEMASTEVLRRFPQWRAELEVLLDCHRLIAPPAAIFPPVGEALGDFRLLAELGRGALGQVFLAAQPSLADRPVVLKLTPRGGTEHLSLARLQHTHIVPLYSVQDFPARNLRALCMPYLGGASLARLLESLRGHAPRHRTGQHLLAALDRAQATAAVALPARGPARQFLTRASYVQAVCWIGACLADALQYAHDRGLVHLDLKPSNVLLALDGQPMILDFHLAHEPIRPDGPPPEWLGGTPDFMAPEQQRALAAVRAGQAVPAVVDGRSDLYALGLLLHEALGGPVPITPAGPLRRCNPQVSRGLADLIAKCLAPDPAERYPDAAALAADLRRHLADLPLRGVANRSPGECWRKWRRRRPHALAAAGMLLAILIGGFAAGTRMLADRGQRLREAQVTLADGQHQLQDHQYAQAVSTFTRGLALAQDLPGHRDLARALRNQLRRARRAHAAQALHQLVDRLRFLYGVDSLPSGAAAALERRCREAWAIRDRITDRAGAALESDVERRIRVDLLDLAILWADLRVRLGSGGPADDARPEALRLLAEAETMFGPSPVLDHQRQVYAEGLGLTGVARAAARRGAQRAPRTAWESYALGRSLLGSGDLGRAATAFERALDREPQAFWPNFYQGVCAYRLGRYPEAVTAFRVCVALAPDAAECFYNRGLAYAALGQLDRAVHDYDRALQLNPGLAAAALNRGMLFYRQHRYPEAIADLQRALDHGAHPAVVSANLDLVRLAQRRGTKPGGTGG